MKKTKYIVIITLTLVISLSSVESALSASSNNPCGVIRDKLLGDACITNAKKSLTLYTSNYLAGAISAIVYKDKQYIMNIGHGASLQYAVSVGGLGESYNPTEAGGKADDYHFRQLDQNNKFDLNLKNDINWSKHANFWAKIPQNILTSSILESFSNTNNSINSRTRMAFWLTPNSVPSYWTNPQTRERVYFPPRANTQAVSNYLLIKDIKMDVDNLVDTIKLSSSIIIPPIDVEIVSALNNSSLYPNVTPILKNKPIIKIEAPTAYLLKDFNKYYELVITNTSETLVDISDKHGSNDANAPYETNNPIIYSTTNSKYAMGVYSLASGNLKAVYQTYKSDSDYSPNTSKLGVSYMVELSTSTKNFDSTTYLIFGTRDTVKKRMAEMYRGNNQIVMNNYKPTGYLDGYVNNHTLYGWAVDKDDQSKAIDVHIYVDGLASKGGRYIGKTKANFERLDVNRSGISGDHGFIFEIPKEYRDGRRHSYYAYGIDLATNSNNNLLTGSPKTFSINRDVVVPAEAYTPANTTNTSNNMLRLSSCTANTSTTRIGNLVSWQARAEGGMPPYLLLLE